MTYSILARDPATGELGIAVATGWPAVGAVVPWLEPGVGAVVTQAFTNLDLGPQGLELLRSGDTATQAVDLLLASDPGRERRQLGVLDAQGGTAAFTGAGCVAEAGHTSATDVSAQGNMLVRAGIPEVMVETYAGLSGDLATRLLAALRAAEAVGGDARGLCSAALVIAPGEGAAQPWSRRIDLRVDDAAEPLVELERVLRTSRAYESLGAGLEAARAGRFSEALEGSGLAFERAPGDHYVALCHGLLLLASGRHEAGERLLTSTLRAQPGLAEYAARWAEVEPESALGPVLRAAAKLGGR